jgi:hypothetical protein
MFMPRLSLYKPEKGKDFEFIDNRIYEMFTVGGTDVNVHKYLGPKEIETAQATADVPKYDVIAETNIQDLLFLENRDRKYDPDIYTLRGIYNVQDIDFNLSQFGLFLSNDTLFMTMHINSTVKTLGRKIMSGDVIELPHLRDEYALNDFETSLKRFYVVEEVSRASEGYSPTWYPHLYRVKLKQIMDSQEYKDIFDKPADEEVPGGDTLRDLLSNYNKQVEINDAVVKQAESDAAKSGYDTTNLFTLEVDESGKVDIVTTDTSELDASTQNELADRVMQTPKREGYDGYLLGDGIAPNGEAFGHGISFPTAQVEGDYFLRTDMLPNRLFRYDGRRWVKIEDSVRMDMTQTNARSTQKSSFVNNTKTDNIGGEVVQERQSLSKALKPKADN